MLRRSTLHAFASCLVVAAAGTTAARAYQLGTFPATTDFATLLNAYRHGDAESAVTAFAQWKEDRIKVEAIPPTTLKDIPTLEAIAMFHTEAGIRNGTFSQPAPGVKMLFLKGWGLDDQFEAHSLTAYRLVDRILKAARRSGDEKAHAFAKSWYILAICFCVRNGRACGRELLEKAESDLDGDDDAEFLLLVGSLHEPRRFTMLRDRKKRAPDWLSQPAIEARWAFTKALKIDPTLVEARLRLGRTYWVTNERQRAERELTKALEDAQATRHLFATHLGAFFLGEMYEEQNQMEEAIKYFRMAVATFPGAHTSSLALGEALVRTEHRDEGWAITRQMFVNEGPGVDPILDPYAIYPFAQSWQNASRLRAMRDWVRQ